MKKTILGLAVLMFMSANLFCWDATIQKGNAYDGYKVYISSTGIMNPANTSFSSTAALIDPSTASNSNLADWQFRLEGSAGTYDVWLDSFPAVNMTGTDEGYKMLGGSTLSLGGRNPAALHGRACSGLGTWATGYFFLSGKE